MATRASAEYTFQVPCAHSVSDSCSQRAPVYSTRQMGSGVPTADPALHIWMTLAGWLRYQGAASVLAARDLPSVSSLTVLLPPTTGSVSPVLLLTGAIVACAFLRCMHRCGGSVQAGKPCCWRQAF